MQTSPWLVQQHGAPSMQAENSGCPSAIVKIYVLDLQLNHSKCMARPSLTWLRSVVCPCDSLSKGQMQLLRGLGWLPSRRGALGKLDPQSQAAEASSVGCISWQKGYLLRLWWPK